MVRLAVPRPPFTMALPRVFVLMSAADFPADDVLLEAPHVGRRQILHRPLADQRNNVPLDTSLIDIKGRRALGVAAAGQDRPRSALSKYSRHRASMVSAPRSSFRVSAGSAPFRTLASVSLASLPALFDGQDAVPPQGKPAAAPVGVAILHQKGLGAACLDPQPKPRQFVIPEEYLTLGRPGRVYESFGELWHLG